MREPSNYPPGVTGTEPEITGEVEPEAPADFVPPEGCDCQGPDTGDIQRISNECPVHNDNP